MHYYEKKLVKSILASWILLFTAVIVTLLAYQGFLMPDNDQPAIWFQRSGAFVVLIAIFADIYFISEPKSISESSDIEARKKHKNLIKFSNIANFSLGVIGTIIWGYGDLIQLKLLM
ncbi:hypothetical protein HNW13_017490 [Shewanella sp. BF02_Schw]|uniref:hypothetical protein n=1 Tax=Shewanella sp. BF02_Schw TaxID=394908 RepID=UPI00177E3048|nr:hypothetical protein [Shewanella sp. BF02_Schw]MBO1897533.1 hypothetical protein [Shewanella sp. BF02_Schw]